MIPTVTTQLDATPTAYTNAELAKTNPLISVDLTSFQDFQLFESFKLWVIGAPDDASSPYSDIEEWYSANASGNVMNVSSWAVVMTLTWNAPFTTPVRPRYRGSDVEYDDMVFPDISSTTTLVPKPFQPTGSEGDMIAALVKVKGKPYKAPAFKVA